MQEMIQERHEANAQGVERADVFTNLLNASESEKGDGALSDLLTGACFNLLPALHSHWPLYRRQYCEPAVDN